MQYAILSDIHANLQAWNSALLDIRSLDLDGIVCLGDIVGYGPNPAEVLKSVHQNVDFLTLGNHDAVICGKMDSSLFNDGAREMVLWTAEQLNSNAIRFLRSLPLSLDGGSFRCTHGEFSDPAAYNYILEPTDALPSWQCLKDQLLFVGHTHRPLIFVLGPSGTPRSVEAQDFVLEPEKRFIVNVGSIGQPRDGDARACYCIVDTETGAVCWRRIPFDIDAYRKALDDAELSGETSYFLRHDPRRGVPPLRELLNFSPARTPEKKVADVVEVQEIKALRRRAKTWRLVCAALLCVFLGSAAFAASVFWRHTHRALDIGVAGTAIDASTAEDGANLVPAPLPAPAGSPVPGWRMHLGDKRSQSVTAVECEGRAAFLLASTARNDELRLCSPPISAGPGMKFRIEALFKKVGVFDGEIALVVPLTRTSNGSNEVLEHFVVKEPNMPRQNGWMLAKKTFTLPANAASIELRLRGKFSGKVLLKDITLTRVK